jgi:amidase
VRDVEPPADFDRLYDEQPLVSGFESARALAHEYSASPELLSERLRLQIEKHLRVPREEYAAAMRHARACRQQFSSAMEDLDVLLTPSAPGEAPKGTESTGNPVFNKNWTLLGVPCVTLPAARGPNGLPLGVQIVGDYDRDERVLECAEWVRQALA